MSTSPPFISGTSVSIGMGFDIGGMVRRRFEAISFRRIPRGGEGDLDPPPVRAVLRRNLNPGIRVRVADPAEVVEDADEVVDGMKRFPILER